MPTSTDRTTGKAVRPVRRYQTKQRDQILACLAGNAGEYLSARQLGEALDAMGKRVGTATLYRNLDRLVEEGVLTTCVSDDGRTTCFRMVDQDEQGGSESERTHFYLRCESCGGMTPIECRELEGFYDHFASEHHVLIDPVRTVLYGTCEQCLNTQAGDAPGTEVASGARDGAGAGDDAGEGRS